MLEHQTAGRERFDLSGRCPVEAAMKVIGSRNAMLTLREAFLGTRRFDDFAVRVEMSPATTAANLRSLTAAGILQRQPYREEGSRTRHEYLLTPSGRELLPVLLGLHDWGTRHAARHSPIVPVHETCGGGLRSEVHCEHGHLVDEHAIAIQPADAAARAPEHHTDEIHSKKKETTR